MNEDKVVCFFLPMIPPSTTFQKKNISVTKNGKAVIYDSNELKEVKQKLMAFLGKHTPPVPLEGALSLTVKWCFPADEKHPPASWKTTKPDTDNLEKALKDCMTKLKFWKDDALVCREIVEKFYNDIPGIYIRAEVME